MSVFSHSKTVTASSIGVPLLHDFTTRGYPLSVSVDPSPPKSVATRTSSLDRYDTVVLAGSGSAYPPSSGSTKPPADRSNSRQVSASLPPGLSRMSALSHLEAGPSSSSVEPCHTHVLAVSVFGGGMASRSRTVVHWGLSVLKESSVVRRHIPF